MENLPLNSLHVHRIPSSLTLLQSNARQKCRSFVYPVQDIHELEQVYTSFFVLLFITSANDIGEPKYL